MLYSTVFNNVWGKASELMQDVPLSKVLEVFEQLTPIVEELPLPDGEVKEQIDFRFWTAKLFADGLTGRDGSEGLQGREEIESLFRAQVAGLLGHFSILSCLAKEKLHGDQPCESF